MSLFPVDQDDQDAPPQAILLAAAPPRKSGLIGGWMISLTLHALLLAILSRLIEPALRGVPGEGTSDRGLLNAVFLKESRKPGSPMDNLDTRLPDSTSGSVVEIVRPKQIIKPVSFTTRHPLPDSAVEDEQLVLAKSSTDDSAAIEPTDSALDPPAETPGPRRVQSGRKGPNRKLADRDHVTSQPGANDDRASSGRSTATATANNAAGRVARGTPGTTFFGVRGNGKRIVYVIDCSGSMSDREVFSRARNELLASLDRLPQAAFVQVIFYNDQTHAIGGGTALVRNSTDQRRRIAQFSRGIVAGGGTHHVPALELALDLDPDALFWLTDADEPYLTSAELQELRRRNHRRIPIHAIEFGYGPELTADNFLKRAAQRSGGTHRYCDLGDTNTSPR